jgi:hypothetical protein
VHARRSAGESLPRALETVRAAVQLLLGPVEYLGGAPVGRACVLEGLARPFIQ